MEEVPEFDIGGGEKLIEMDSYSEEDLLGWLFKDDLQNIELVELNIAPENPGLAPQPQPQAQSRWHPSRLKLKGLQFLGFKKPQKRFKTVTPEELKDLQDSRQAKSTKQNTKWGVNVFQEWCMKALDQVLDFATIETEELNNVLGKFYLRSKLYYTAPNHELCVYTYMIVRFKMKCFFKRDVL
ncbi:unnamed protein product [Mytilus coruscus]|uniref:Uncharacterized protein n=1 Tax=Mytilus coruscus TaxID=42192 RepID=A0A6J8DN65_MYTCO|nr:unnamed protein product [Mytilus coruscus]